MTDQIRLFNQLRRIGLVDMITDLTGKDRFAPTPMKTVIHIPTGQPMAVPKKYERLTSRDISESYYPPGWQVKIEKPVMSDNGKWQRGFLAIDITREHHMRFAHHDEITRADSVSITYSNRQRLVIVGEQTTFNDLVNYQNPTPEQTSQLEEATAQAFFRPLVVNPVENRRQAEREPVLQAYREQFGEEFGAAIGEYVFAGDNIEAKEKLAREFGKRLSGLTHERNALATLGLITALEDRFNRIINPVASAAREAQFWHTRF